MPTGQVDTVHELAGVRVHVARWGLWRTEAHTPHPKGTAVIWFPSIVAMKEYMFGFARDSDF